MKSFYEEENHITSGFRAKAIAALSEVRFAFLVEKLWRPGRRDFPIRGIFNKGT